MKKIGKEIDLLARYPKAKRDLSKRLENKTDKDRKIAREFGKDFFDGHRSHGYGGFSYNPKYWTDVIKDFVKFYDLQDGSKILDHLKYSHLNLHLSWMKYILQFPLLIHFQNLHCKYHWVDYFL